MRRKFLAVLIGFSAASSSHPAAAQTGVYAVPAVGISSIYDDNLFFDIDDAQSDTALRVTPELEVGYESERTNAALRYSFDAESYNKFTELNSSAVRKFADFEASHQASRRVTLEGEAHYTRTNTPLDLSLLSGVLQGLVVGRTDAERIAVQPGVAIVVSPTTNARLTYSYTNDTLSDSLESTTNMFESEVVTQVTPTTNLEYGYIFRRYSFERLAALGLPAQDFDTQDSHTPWVGVQHDLSSNTQFRGRIGPRFLNSQVNPYVQLSLRRLYAQGSMELGYERNETTLLGELGRHEMETFSAALLYNRGTKFELSIRPAYGKLSQDDYAVDIYRAGLIARYRIRPYFHLTASYDAYYQEVDFIDGRTEDVARNVVSIGFYLTYPRREDRTTR
jgi:hypothetical protein